MNPLAIRPPLSSIRHVALVLLAALGITLATPETSCAMCPTARAARRATLLPSIAIEAEALRSRDVLHVVSGASQPQPQPHLAQSEPRALTRGAWRVELWWDITKWLRIATITDELCQLDAVGGAP